MNDYKQIIKNAKPGQIVPIVKQIDIDDPMDFFARISDYGRLENSCLFDSREHLAGHSALSFGTTKPALYLTGQGNDFTIKALSPTGERMLTYLASDKDRFSFCETLDITECMIAGQIRRDKGVVDEHARLNNTNQMDVLRAVAFSFKLASKPFRVTCGLLGALSYDFIDQFETLPQNEQDILGNPDYELYFADNIFLVDHANGQGYVVVNCIITDDRPDQAIEEAQACFDYYSNMSRFEAPRPELYTGPLPESSTDTDQATFEAMVKTAKKHIIDGDIYTLKEIHYSRVIAYHKREVVFCDGCTAAVIVK